MNENELEKHEMKIVVEETLGKHKNCEGGLYESEQARIMLQQEYEKVSQ